MKISSVYVKLAKNPNDRLKGFGSLTFEDAFVIRDLKIIEGTNGCFVAMPSRRIMDHCPVCGSKNHLLARFCNDCGKQLTANRSQNQGDRSKLHVDIAHPINSRCRAMIQECVLEEYENVLRQSEGSDGDPLDYEDRYDDQQSDPDEQQTAVADSDYQDNVSRADQSDRQSDLSEEFL